MIKEFLLEVDCVRGGDSEGALSIQDPQVKLCVWFVLHCSVDTLSTAIRPSYSSL